MPSFLEQQPGLLYVAATLLPLLSFLVLLLAGAVRNWARASWPDAPYWAAEAGRPPTKVSAYIATGAIGLAFLLSFAGFLLFQADHQGHGTHATAHEHEHADDAKEEKDDEHAEAPDRWASSMAWAWVGKGAEDERGGIMLRLGYRIDSL